MYLDLLLAKYGNPMGHTKKLIKDLISLDHGLLNPNCIAYLHTSTWLTLVPKSNMI